MGALRGLRGAGAARRRDPGAVRDVEFVWRVGTGVPRPDGVRVMLRDEPTGEGTYRISNDLPWVIDVPPGIEIVFDGIWRARPLPGVDAPTSWALLLDVATASKLHIDP